MTDNEIIKALECCNDGSGLCSDDCPLRYNNDCRSDLASCTIDLINRQKAEIERLTINMNAFGLGMKREKEMADTARAEAIKEFAERLKATMENFARMDFRGSTYFCVGLHHIDNLVKELTEEKNDE